MSYLMSKTARKNHNNSNIVENDPADMVRYAIHELTEKFSDEPHVEKIITVLQVLFFAIELVFDLSD